MTASARGHGEDWVQMGTSSWQSEASDQVGMAVCSHDPEFLVETLLTAPVVKAGAP